MSPVLALANQFEEQSKRNITDAIPATEEIEYKLVLNFSSKQEANKFAEQNGLPFPTAFIQQALEDEGFCVEARETKNLTSYYFDTFDRMLNRMGISLRMRHNEKPRCETNGTSFDASRPDLSFKIPTKEGCNAKRLEYQAITDMGEKPGGFGFKMSFRPLIERYVSEFMKDRNPRAAVQWASTVYRTFNGFDWGQYREHFSINCKRTMPYITLYSMKDADGNLVRDEDGKVLVQTKKPYIVPAGTEIREIVWQFCLDTNRYFAKDPQNPDKCIHFYDDHEIEYELQVQGDEYTPDAKSSSLGITYEESNAAKAVINHAIHRALKKYGIEKCVHRSNESKQARGFVAIDKWNEKNPEQKIKPDSEFTIRGRKDLHVLEKLSWDEMVAKVPVLKSAIDKIGNFVAPHLKNAG
jgi:hypothetical protein